MQRSKGVFRKIGLASLTFALAACLLACSPQVSKSPSGSSGEGEAPVDGVEFIWSTESNCLTCHTSQTDSFQNQACAASSHTGVDCLTCHTDTAGMEKGHQRVEATDTDGADKLKRSDVDATVCLSCHDLATLKEKTADSTSLIDKNGTIVNPHDLPESDDHSRVNCTSCHKLHSDGPVETAAYEQCTNCHHAEVFECGTCHSH